MHGERTQADTHSYTHTDVCVDTTGSPAIKETIRLAFLPRVFLSFSFLQQRVVI